MALFARRCLKRLLDENAKFLKPGHVEEHARRLDKVRDDYLATEWEIAILNALSKVGTVEHEPHNLAGKRFLDVVFSSTTIQFAADIATVSDQQLHRRNPVDQIWEELARRVQKRKITTGGFDLDIGHSPEASQGRGFRHDLLIPPISKLRDTVFNRDFDAFLGRIVSNPLTRHQFRVRNSFADITISYDPKRESWGGSHLAYTSANIVDDNPVFNALKQKAGHLKGSGYKGPRGVIVCDGGCEMLSSDGVSWEGFTLRQVVADFLRQNQSIAFVITIGLHHDRSSSIGRGHYRPSLGVWVPRAFAPLKIPLQSVFERMISYLPIIETSATNALYRVKEKDRRASIMGWHPGLAFAHQSLPALHPPLSAPPPTASAPPIICASVCLLFDIHSSLSFVRNHMQFRAELGDQVSRRPLTHKSDSTTDLPCQKHPLADLYLTFTRMTASSSHSERARLHSQCSNCIQVSARDLNMYYEVFEMRLSSSLFTLKEISHECSRTK